MPATKRETVDITGLSDAARDVIQTVLSEIGLTADNLGGSANAEDYAVDVVTRLARSYLQGHPDLAAFTD